jgi:pimeloyl-ACP methyl ester carboxylesterase
MKVLVNGQLIEYKTEGKGKAVLLLHGWGSSLSTFDSLAKALSPHYKVVRFDFPGFGASPKPADDWGVTEYAALTADLLKKLKINALHAVVGHSFGGRVIIKGYSSGVLTADKVVLIGAAGIKPARTLRRAAFGVAAKAGKVVTAFPGLRSLRTKLRKALYTAAGSTDYLEAKAMQKIFLKTINEDLTPEISTVTSPSLLLWGEHDTEVPVRDAKIMNELLGDSELVIIPGAGHFVHTDESESVEKKIKEFLV